MEKTQLMRQIETFLLENGAGDVGFCKLKNIKKG